jgi:hypothetical protein
MTFVFMALTRLQYDLVQSIGPPHWLFANTARPVKLA